MNELSGQVSVDELQLHNYQFCKPNIVSISTQKNKKLCFNNNKVPLLNEDLISMPSESQVDSGFTSDYNPESNNKDTNEILECLKMFINSEDKKSPIDIVCYRGSMTKIFSFPYEHRDNHKFAIIKLDNCLFLWWYRSKEDEPNLEAKRSIYSGFRFEKLITKSKDDEDASNLLPQESTIFSVTNQLKSHYYCHNLFYVGEVDCQDENGNIVEIKCRRKKGKYIDFATKRYCFLKWWVQSFLIGVKRLIVGYRNDQYQIVDIQDMKLSDLYKSIDTRNPREYWDPNLCMMFGGHFFQKLKDIMKNFKEHEICIAEFNPTEKRVKFSKTNKHINPEYYFLPDEFVKFWNEKL